MLEGPGNLISKSHSEVSQAPLFLLAWFFFIPPDTYTCSADGEWISVGGKSELPKCIEGTLSNFIFY